MSLKQNYSQLVTEIGRIVGNVDDTHLNNVIKERFNRNYEELWNAFLWPGTIMRGSTATVASRDRIAFAYPVREIITLWQRDTPDWIMVHDDPMQFIRNYYAHENTEGVPTDAMVEGKHFIHTDLPSDVTIDVLSDDAADTTQTVRIYGKKSNGAYATENLALNGTTAVVSTNTYESTDQRMTFEISLSAVAAGTITIRGNDASDTEIATIRPGEIASEYLWYKLLYIPSAVGTVYWIAKKQPRRLVNDQDVTSIDVDSILVPRTCADLLDHLQMDASYWRGVSNAAEAAAKAEILGQSARMVKFVPESRHRYNLA